MSKLPSFLKRMEIYPPHDSVKKGLNALARTAGVILSQEKGMQLIAPLNGSYFPIKWLERYGKQGALEGQQLLYTARDDSGIYRFTEPINPSISTALLEDIYDSGETEKRIRELIKIKHTMMYAASRKITRSLPNPGYAGTTISGEWALNTFGMNGVKGVDPEVTVLERLAGETVTLKDSSINDPVVIAKVLNANEGEYRDYLVQTSLVKDVMQNPIFHKMLAIETAPTWQEQVSLAQEPLSVW